MQVRLITVKGGGLLAIPIIDQKEQVMKSSTMYFLGVLMVVCLVAAVSKISFADDAMMNKDTAMMNSDNGTMMNQDNGMMNQDNGMMKKDSY